MIRPSNAPSDRKRLLGNGQLAPPLLARIRAQQYFLEAVQEEVSNVIIDLREIVYPKYCEAREFSTSLIADWAKEYNFLDLERTIVDWIRSCTELTLYAWSIKDGFEWARTFPGRPEMTVDVESWAKCNGLPAIETWVVDQHDAYKLTANIADLPNFASYDFLVMLANGRLAALDENGYREIPADMSRFNSIVSTTFGPVGFNPLEETEATARMRITEELLAELDRFLKFSTSTLQDWQGYLDKTKSKDTQHFSWTALHIAGGKTIAKVAEAFGKNAQTVASAVNEIRDLLGLARPAGRPPGIKETQGRTGR
jgi:hypothetical protein